MIRNAFLFVNKGLLLFGVLLLSNGAFAQKKAPDSYKSFLNTQFWLGLRFGLNYTDPLSKEPYTAFSAIDNLDETYAKTYNVFDIAGGQAGLDLALYHKGFSIGLQPTFKIIRYSYFSELSWLGNEPIDDFETRYDIKQIINIVEVPLVIKYDVLRDGKIRPFVMGGLQYSFIVGANKDTKITNTEYSTGNGRSFSGGEISLGTRDQFKNFYGAVGGVGANFDYANIRTILEISYLYALSSATETTSLFQENELVSLGEVNDEINLNNINIAICFVFPLRYIDKTFQPY